MVAEETIRLTAEFLGILEIEAAFIVGQEFGEIDGDVITIDEDGREIRHRDAIAPEREQEQN